MKEYYSYKLQVRKDEGQHVRLAGCLYQQYVVDAFSCVEQARLWWLCTHQKNLRSDLYNSMAKKFVNVVTDTLNIGKGFVLPANFLGSQRYMQQNFQDALSVCRVVGHPDIFLTMTCTPLWDEISQMMKVLPGCYPHNSPDVISRVFHLKLQQLIDDIQKKTVFGTCIGVMYVVEFQKRGLPYVHKLIWPSAESKKDLNGNIDGVVSADIPDPLIDPAGYAAVKSLMIHGPCGLQNPKSACMSNMSCTKHFPKRYNKETYFDQSGFPIYKRRNTGITVQKGKCTLDNAFVVPYNCDLLVKYQCHMNVEICCHARSLKYLFKYCLKGHDRATIKITNHRNKNNDGEDGSVDEISAYFDGRYICAFEATYCIFGYPVHYHSIYVLRLSFHLPGEPVHYHSIYVLRLSFHLSGERSCTFTETEIVERVIRQDKNKYSQLEAFFLNSEDPSARPYTYDEIPQYYVWNETDRKCTVRKKGRQIGRLLYTHHSSGKLWYLRMLLSNVRGSTSFESLRTVNGVRYRSFNDAFQSYGLLDDDNEWHSVIAD
ncbi:uncharacterized protein LOC141674172 [Apium graveolens]|uniref:uncharacterized protein LOC141674172 n=1 Tax=Apium graveolens TaxID=4045 RepID=UPI003D797AC5